LFFIYLEPIWGAARPKFENAPFKDHPNKHTILVPLKTDSSIPFQITFISISTQLAHRNS